MQPNFNDFLNDCNSKYDNEYFSKYTKAFSNAQLLFNETYNVKDDKYLLKFYLLEKYTSSVLINLSNEIALNHLKDYHEWLTTNFDVKPKLT